MLLTIGLIKEGRIPQDNRVALTPEQCESILHEFPEVTIIAESSPFRCFKDEEYKARGIPIQQNMQDCDLLLGIKEVPTEMLIPGKTYLFFSHTTKMQPYNRDMLRAILANNIRLIDYELLTDENGKRLLGFGHYAGIVGAHYALLMYGKRTGTFELPPAHQVENYQTLIETYSHVGFPPLKIAIAGAGKVGKGARELLLQAGIREVTPEAFRQGEFAEPVFALLKSEHLYERKDGQAFDKEAFKADPAGHRSRFPAFFSSTDVLINAVYWDSDIPRHFEVTDTARADFRIRTITDVSCDIRGAVPVTVQHSFRENPFYGFDLQTNDLAAPFQENTIDLMAIDNLPNELPKDASQDFGEVLRQQILPTYIQDPGHPMFQRATIAEEGKLTEAFAYLKSYVGGK